ncbi:MAG: NFACT RNA binding domain-containing protein [Calditerrivibrio sp.]|uniref:NFACT RNA binding domain-containing protein n=1 Tax=Calditerrivibrio sp. TaxID=2792612 RepID=UPI003C81699A
MDGLLLYKFLKYLNRFINSNVNNILTDGNNLCLIVYSGNDRCYIVFDMKDGSIYFPGSFSGKEVFSKLNSSQIISFKQRGYDRAFYIQVKKRKASGISEYFKLVFELVGGNSNFFILDNGHIILYRFSDKNIDQDRDISIGCKYQVFRSNKQFSLDNYDSISDFNLLEGFYKKTADFANRLIGIKGEVGDVVCYIKELLSDENIYIDSDGRAYPFRISEDLNEINIKDYKCKFNKEKKVFSFEGIKRQLKKRISDKKDLLKKLEGELSIAENYHELLHKAEILKNNLFRIDEAMRSGEFLEFTPNGEKIVSIELKDVRDMDAYIESLFNRGKKLERSIPLIRRRISDIKMEIDFYEELSFFLDNGDIDYDEIGDLLKPDHRVKKGRTKKVKRYYKYGKDDFILLIGRNSFGNDEILGLADKEDIWFHVHGYPSSHVILKSNVGLPSYDLLTDVARVTAYYSVLKNEQKVAVDWTSRKYVRKVKGAAKGFVIYDRFKTIMVQPASPEEIGFTLEEK